MQDEHAKHFDTESFARKDRREHVKKTHGTSFFDTGEIKPGVEAATVILEFASAKGNQRH
jgi:hypothetical protein